MDAPPDPTLPNPADTSVGNRFAHFSPDNHSATIWIASLLGLIYTALSLTVRLYVKRSFLGWDDWLIVASTVVGLAQFISVFEALEDGLGQRVDLVSNLVGAAKLVFTSRFLLVISLYLSKCSSILLIRRIFVRDHRAHTILCDVILALIAICGVASIFISSVGCPSGGFFFEHCSGQKLRWRIVTGLDIATEFVLLFLPTYLVWQLQMKTERKIHVIMAFAFRILIVVFSVLHLFKLVVYTDGTPSPLRISDVMIWQQCILAYSIISATIPNLKAFAQSLSTNFGGDQFGYTSSSGGHYGHNSYKMQSLNKSQGTHSDHRSTFSRAKDANPHAFKVQITSTGRENERASVGSAGSRDLIIRKDTQWNIESTEVESPGYASSRGEPVQ